LKYSKLHGYTYQFFELQSMQVTSNMTSA